MNLENGWYVDKNNNRWDASTTSYDEALVKSSYLEDCTGCVNCHSCTLCVNCVGCTSCSGCIECVNCYGCAECESCADCTKCADCEGSTGCVGCGGCISCKDIRNYKENMDYLKILNDSWKINQDTDKPCGSKQAFLSENVFDFAAYDSNAAKEMGSRCLQVCKAINDNKTLTFTSEAINYTWYLFIVNSAFIKDKIDWAVSIQGSWWSTEPGLLFEVKSDGLFDNGEQYDYLGLDKDQWVDFVDAMVKFVKD